VLANELKCLVVDPIGGVVGALEAGIALGVQRVGALGEARVAGHRWPVVQRDPLVVAPEVGGIVAVGVSLAVVAKEAIEALLQRVPFRARCAQPPLAEGARCVAFPLQQFGQGQLGVGNRPLTLQLDLAVAADPGMAGVPAGHQHTAGRSTDGVARVVTQETHALPGQPVEVGRADLLLAVRTQFGVAQIVGHDEHDVGSPGLRSKDGRHDRRVQHEQQDGQDGEPGHFSGLKIVGHRDLRAGPGRLGALKAPVEMMR